MICLTCNHICHCEDVCQEGNGCGCNKCEHGKDRMIKKLWQKIVEWLWK